MDRLPVTILLLVFSSCGVCKYEFSEAGVKILSLKRNPIDAVSISNEKNQTLAVFKARTGTFSKEFSLKDFSPANFECIEGCLFQFEKGKRYNLSISPTYDRLLLPLMVDVKHNGDIVEARQQPGP